MCHLKLSLWSICFSNSPETRWFRATIKMLSMIAIQNILRPTLSQIRNTPCHQITLFGVFTKHQIGPAQSQFRLCLVSFCRFKWRLKIDENYFFPMLVYIFFPFWNTFICQLIAVICSVMGKPIYLQMQMLFVSE